MRNGRAARDERGFALVVSVLILLVMSMLGLVLMAGVSMNRNLMGNDQRMREALNVAEAGVGEALGRISHQDVGMDPADPRDVCQVFNTLAGTVPVLGADSSALATAQPAGAWLDYTTPGRMSSRSRGRRTRRARASCATTPASRRTSTTRPVCRSTS
jgi:Tfp pilus assembly protein PilX